MFDVIGIENYEYSLNWYQTKE